MALLTAENAVLLIQRKYRGVEMTKRLKRIGFREGYGVNFT